MKRWNRVGTGGPEPQKRARAAALAFVLRHEWLRGGSPPWAGCAGLQGRHVRQSPPGAAAGGCLASLHRCLLEAGAGGKQEANSKWAIWRELSPKACAGYRGPPGPSAGPRGYWHCDWRGWGCEGAVEGTTSLGRDLRGPWRQKDKALNSQPPSPHPCRLLWGLR